MDKTGRMGVENIAKGSSGFQKNLFDEPEPEWVEVNIKGIRVENIGDFGGPWLGLNLMDRLGIDRFLGRL